MATALLILVTFLIPNVISFYQNIYDLEHSHVTLDYIDKNYIAFMNVHNTKFNRTTRTFAAETSIINPLTTAALFKIEAYMYLSNEYKKFPALQIGGSMCGMMKTNLLGVLDVLKDTNMTFECPIPPGIYYVRNVAIDSSKLPPGVPFGQYRMAITLSERKTKLISISWYGAVVPKQKNG